MREIKFRAWGIAPCGGHMGVVVQTRKSVMINNLTVRDIYDAGVLGERGDLGTPRINTPGAGEFETDYIFMQSTGLKDKNGKEIYEGDILRQRDMEMLQEVTWTGSRISLRSLPDNDDFEDLYEIGSFELEVVGNIHENPELLNG